MDARYAKALEGIGGLSQTTKLSCASWSLPPSWTCHWKEQLKGRCEDLVCSRCYACRNNYRFKNVVQAMYRRQRAYLENPDFWEDFTTVLERHERLRLFDAGDVPDEQFYDGLEWAQNESGCRIYLPTKKFWYVDVAAYLPRKTTIRHSLWLVDPTANAITEMLTFHRTHTICSVHRTEPEPHGIAGKAFLCPATWTSDHHCGSCSACWDETIPWVAYKLH